jgi:two-component sensor histidine kinase
MRTRRSKVVCAAIFSIWNWSIGMAQIIDFTEENSYKKVFVATDNFGPSYLDVLEDAYTKAPTDSLRFTILNDLAYYWHTRDLKKALAFTKLGLHETQEADCISWHGRFQITQGAILLRMEKLTEALQALEEARSKVNEQYIPFLITQIGYIYERQGNLSKAADYAMQSLELGSQLNDLHAQALAYSDLSNLYWKQGKYKRGLEQGLRSLELFEQIGMNDLDYDFTLYVVGNNYVGLNQYEEAKEMYNHAMSIGERYGFYNNLSDIYISLVDLNGRLNQFEEGKFMAFQAIKYSELLHNNFMLMRSWLSLGKLQNLEGKYLSAVESLQKSITIATEDFGDSYYLSEAYENLGRAHAGSHNYKDAYLAFEVYDRLKQEVFTSEASQKMSLLQTEYEVAQKENTIQLQNTKIKRQRTTQTLILIVSILLLLYLILLFKSVLSNRKKNRLLEQKNEEKEFLLKEIHHRVKNNLEIVSSLLSLQSEQIQDPVIKNTMLNSQQRVHSMSMIHEKLYQGDSMSHIEMKEYFTNLGEYIIQTFGKEDQITLITDMHPIEVDIDYAIPIGLIVNELISNSLKYAFPNQRKGQVSISLKQTGSILHLEVSDNGIGKNLAADSIGTGFGSQLIRLLTEQLEGKMTLMIEGGTAVSFDFQLPQAA